MTNLRLTKQLADLAEPLDEFADPVQEAVNAVPQPVRDVLDGVWLGNPLHPALTDVPIGAWSAAFALDLAGSTAADVSERTIPSPAQVGHFFVKISRGPSVTFWRVISTRPSGEISTT